jgi:predicted flap endonuclease-1-like 5' DNA nuclease
MSLSDYRARAGDVRRAARAKLVELRAERLARRRYAAPVPPGAQDDAAAALQDVEAAPAVGLRFTASSAAAQFAAQAAQAAQDHEHAQHEAPPAAEPQPAREPEPAPARPARGPVLSVSGSLQSLPGVGPGLVWLLNEQGIGSLEDLAARDPEELRSVLGLLGPFVDIDSWIALARGQAQG